MEWPADYLHADRQAVCGVSARYYSDGRSEQGYDAAAAFDLKVMQDASADGKLGRVPREGGHGRDRHDQDGPVAHEGVDLGPDFVRLECPRPELIEGDGG